MIYTSDSNLQNLEDRISLHSYQPKIHYSERATGLCHFQLDPVSNVATHLTAATHTYQAEVKKVFLGGSYSATINAIQPEFR